MKIKTTQKKYGKLSADMLELVTAIIQYIDLSDMQVRKERGNL